MNSIRLAFRNLSRQKKRSLLLCGAIAFGFFVVTVIDSLTAGLMDNMSDQFANLFGGHVIVYGSEWNEDDKLINVLREGELLDQALIDSGLEYNYVCKRSSAYGKLIFGGQNVFLNLFGCDFDKEVFLADSMTLVEGSFDGMKQKNAVILGEATVKKLKVAVGDTVVFQTETVTGQATFGEFLIVGVSKDSSLMGSIASYANKSYINELIGLPEDGFMMFNVMLHDQKLQTPAAQQLTDTLISKGKLVADLKKARQESPTAVPKALERQMKANKSGLPMYCVEALDDEMPQVKQLLGITQIVSICILLVLFFIVMIGISNTFKMIINERIREIGTMRAIGMHQGSVGRMFIWEALLLSVLGAAAGFVLAVIGMNILSLFYFSSSGLSLFLNNGHWAYVLSPLMIMIKFILIMVLTVGAVIGSAIKGSRLNPAEALRTVN